MPDEYLLENIKYDNEIQTDLFVPFTILRLKENLETETKYADCLINLKDIKESGKRQRILHLYWRSEAITLDSIPVQSIYVTELAACGIACVLVPLYAKLKFLSVAQRGDRFDYWIGNETQRWGLEVSGTIQDNLVGRHRIKVRQLLSNPYDVSGFVSVTRFASRKSLLSFHLNKGEDTMENRYPGGIREEALSEEFRRLDIEKSNFILQANLLKEQRKYREAIEKFATAAEIETKLSDSLRKERQMKPYFIHRFSAASCWAQAGNIYLAKEMLKELLSEKEIPGTLSNHIKNYLSTLEKRVQKWLKDYAFRKSMDIN